MGRVSHDTTQELPRDIRRDIERLDRWSNAASDSTQAGRFDKADELCRKLLKHYPNMIDGPHRLAELRSAQGRWREAAEAYDQALDVIALAPEGYDRGGVAAFRRVRDLARANAGLPPTRSLPPEVAAYLAPPPLRLVQFIVRKFREFRVK